MKYFTSTASVVRTVRKEGYYPRLTVAKKLARSLLWVWGAEKDASALNSVARCINGDHECMNYLRVTLTPSEFGMMFDLMDWWAKDTSGEIQNIAGAFIGLNLNSGRHIVVLDRNERGSVCGISATKGAVLSDCEGSK